MTEPDALFDEDALEAARILFARKAEFMMGAVAMDGLPAPDLPEVAFAGRSNVGKSSLINALVGHKHLARASNAPGRTREVNFFVLDERLRLVDLPGYGWARAARSEVKKFQNLGRHGLKEVDGEPMDAFDRAAVSYQIVLTKADKLRPAAVEAVRQQTEAAIAKRPAAFPRVLATSSETGAGMPELRAEIAAACAVAP